MHMTQATYRNNNSNLTMKDMVESTMGKPAFGFNFYKTPSNEMLQKKAPFGMSNKEKNPSFGEQMQKKKGWVPSPDKYNLGYDWLTNSPKRAGEFLKKPRQTFSDEIIQRTLKANGPSPASYDVDKKWKTHSNQKKTTGNYTYREEIITFVGEASNVKDYVPASNKYDKVPLDNYLNRTMSTKIHNTNLPRFQPIKKDQKPAPTSYNAADSITSTKWTSTRYSIKKDKKVFI